jgi:hypothetical protein
LHNRIVTRPHEAKGQSDVFDFNSEFFDASTLVVHEIHEMLSVKPLIGWNGVANISHQRRHCNAMTIHAAFHSPCKSNYMTLDAADRLIVIGR